jgi:hypothetical protein
MVKVMQNIHATLKENCKIANKAMLCEHLDEVIKEVQSMAVRCGQRKDQLNTSWQPNFLRKLRIDPPLRHLRQTKEHFFG